jgi:hypothetical protein
LCVSSNLFALESFLPLIQFLLPKFIPDNFELTSVDRQDDVFHAHTITIQDFPIRGHQVFLHIKRRRWLNTQTGKVVYRDWTQERLSIDETSLSDGQLKLNLVSLVLAF